MGGEDGEAGGGGEGGREGGREGGTDGRTDGRTEGGREGGRERAGGIMRERRRASGDERFQVRAGGFKRTGVQWVRVGARTGGWMQGTGIQGSTSIVSLNTDKSSPSTVDTGTYHLPYG